MGLNPEADLLEVEVPVDLGEFALNVRALLAGPSGFRQKKLLYARRAWCREAEIKSFPSPALQEIARMVFAYCQTKAIQQDFPIVLSDNLYKIYGASIEELIDLVSAVCQKCHIESPSGSQVELIVTVKDAIEVIAGQAGVR